GPAPAPGGLPAGRSGGRTLRLVAGADPAGGGVPPPAGGRTRRGGVPPALPSRGPRVAGRSSGRRPDRASGVGPGHRRRRRPGYFGASAPMPLLRSPARGGRRE